MIYTEPVRMVTITADNNKLLWHALLSAGGMCLVKCSDQIRLVEFVKHLPEHFRETAKFEDVYVFVVEELVKFLEPKELGAAMAHEEGHFILGHHVDNGSGILFDIEKEIAADKYAAKKYSPADMISVLRRTIEFTIEIAVPLLAKGNNIMEGIIVEQVMTVTKEDIVPRIKALQSMI